MNQRMVIFFPHHFTGHSSPRYKEFKWVVGDVHPHLISWVKYPDFLFLISELPWCAVADSRSSTLLELQRTVTHGDNVNVLRLYLDEWDVMSLNVDKAEPLLPKGRPLWGQYDLIFQNATIHTSWGPKPAELRSPPSDCGTNDSSIQQSSFLMHFFFTVFFKLTIRIWR